MDAGLAMAALAITRGSVNAVGIMAAGTSHLRVLSIQGEACLGVIKILHPVNAIVATQAVVTEVLDV